MPKSVTAPAGDTELSDTVRIRLLGANPTPAITPFRKLPDTVNYYTGSDPNKWHTSIPTYAEVRYEAVYPGVNLIYHSADGQLEYDFVVSPGADPAKIALDVSL
ncbi:MAG: SBBP repeat-containing protein, partial [Terriglobia bacterium]